MFYQIQSDGACCGVDAIALIQGPENGEDSIRKAVENFKIMHTLWTKSAKELGDSLERQFAAENGDPPNKYFGTFGDFYPDMVPILAAGKTHKDWQEAKDAQKLFTKAKKQYQETIKSYYNRRGDYVRKNMANEPAEPKFRDYLPAGFTIVSTTEVYIEDLYLDLK